MQKHFLKSLFRILSLAILCVVFLSNSDEKGHVKPSLNMCSISPYELNKNQANEDNDTQFVIDPDYVWNDKTKLKVYFFDVSKGTAKKTIKIANEWLKHSKMFFVITENSSQSDIRVAFHRGEGYKSLIGIEAKELQYRGLPTLWLENLDNESDDVFERTVLHEFGHSLGLLHELQNPNAKIEWKKEETIAHFKSLKWSLTEIEKNILNPAPVDIESSSYDPNSIMIYQIPGDLLKSGKSIPWPKGLSRLDENRIRDYYK